MTTPLVIALACNMLGFLTVGMQLEAGSYNGALGWGIVFSVQAIYNLYQVADL